MLKEKHIVYGNSRLRTKNKKKKKKKKCDAPVVVFSSIGESSLPFRDQLKKTTQAVLKERPSATVFPHPNDLTITVSSYIPLS